MAVETIALKDATGATVNLEADLNGTNYVQVLKVAYGADGTRTLVETAAPLPVIETQGTYAYASGTATGTVNVPGGARLKRVSVIAGTAASATVTIGGGATITIPAGASFDEVIPGSSVAPAVVIGGTIQSYYVAWVA